MDHKGYVLSGHVAPLNKTEVRNICTYVTTTKPIFYRVSVVCSESWGQRAFWIVLPVGVISNVDIDLSGVILVEVSCGDLAKEPTKYILDEED